MNRFRVVSVVAAAVTLLLAMVLLQSAAGATSPSTIQAPSAPGGIAPDVTNCAPTQAGISFTGVGLYTVNYYFSQGCSGDPVIVTDVLLNLETNSGTVVQSGSPSGTVCATPRNIFGSSGAYQYSAPLSSWYYQYQFEMTTTDGSVWLPSNQCTGGSITTFCTWKDGPYQAPL
jgi:hypothetical protein